MWVLHQNIRLPDGQRSHRATAGVYDTMWYAFGKGFCCSPVSWSGDRMRMLVQMPL